MRVAVRVLAVIIAILTSPARAAETDRMGPRLPVEAYELPNGLKVVLHRDASVPRVVVAVAYHVGARNERAGRTGFAHFFEHMMFRGTRNVPNYDIPLQETGAQSNAFTTEDLTVYHETVSSEFLERALYLEAERLAFLPEALDQAKFDTEREVVKNERRQGVDNVPYGQVEEAILQGVFPKGHPYSWSVIGSMRDLDRASLADLRSFFAEFYHPANATLCLAGDFDPSRAKALIGAYFGPLSPGPRPAAPSRRLATPRPASVELADEVELPRIHWAWPTVDEDHPDSAPLGLLAGILASGETSRLYKALVRDLRLAKDVDSDDSPKEIAGYFTLEATAAEGKSIEDIEAVFRKEIGRLKAEAPSPQEVERLKAGAETGTYAGLTTAHGRAVALATGYASKGDPEHYRVELARIFRVTPEDVRRVARKYLVDEKVRILVRPARPGEPKTTVEPVGPDPAPHVAGDAAPAAARKPAPGPDWTKLPGPSEPLPFLAPKYVQASLSNGVRVYIAPWKTLPLVRLSLFVPAGTGDDPAGKSGVAHLMARLLDQGTAGRTATELSEAYELLGASVRVGSGADETSLSVAVLARNFRPTLDLFAEMVTRPRFDPKDFDREQAQQLADLLQGPTQVNWMARRALPAIMFGRSHPYGNPSDGFPATVRALALEDVRAFHAAHFGPKDAVLVVAGDVDPDALIKALERALGGWRGSNPGARPRPAESARPEPGVVYLVDKPDAVQSVIRLGRHWADRRDPRYMATLVGNHLTGGDFLSRLNKNLREDHGYTYGAGSTFDFRRGRSVWGVATSVRADVTGAALAEIVKELDGIGGGRPITEEEVATARWAEARSFPEAFESPSGIAAELAELARFGLPADELESFLPRLERVSAEEVQRAMAEVVAPSGRYILVVGDRKAVEPQLRNAGFRNIRPITHDGSPIRDEPQTHTDEHG
ncbi:Peptidase M16 inactive domain protein [Aquisphaera giovannonii]|uniref:Peptidase M16 inactive domain protein n=1 Tax=Aquisphaera giovannonii TaxID=406548 RepID=A0A5B9W8I0_9BACT|nr:pitrilysin family protein [Aquisphaera giovannonii]QEH36996.1 Peptidase M16 inactive domain protein [Aquisphaera giovannonii]